MVELVAADVAGGVRGQDGAAVPVPPDDADLAGGGAELVDDERGARLELVAAGLDVHRGGLGRWEERGALEAGRLGGVGDLVQPVALPRSGDDHGDRRPSRLGLVEEGADTVECGGEGAGGRLGREAVEHPGRRTLAAAADRHRGGRGAQVDSDCGCSGGAMLHVPSLWTSIERFQSALRLFVVSYGDSVRRVRFVPERDRKVTTNTVVPQYGQRTRRSPAVPPSTARLVPVTALLAGSDR